MNYRHIATTLSSDPYDERCGVFFSLPDSNALSALPAGTKLYVDSEVTVPLSCHRRKRIYLAGSTAGIPDYNFHVFNEVAEFFRSHGLHVENPAEHGIVQHATWEDYLRYDIAKLMTCEAIVFLPNWESSKGAMLEYEIAKSLKMPVFYWECKEKILSIYGISQSEKADEKEAI